LNCHTGLGAQQGVYQDTGRSPAVPAPGSLNRRFTGESVNFKLEIVLTPTDTHG
jgi:hypothetical protein